MHPDGSSEVDYMARVDPTNKPKMYRKNVSIAIIEKSIKAPQRTIGYRSGCIVLGIAYAYTFDQMI